MPYRLPESAGCNNLPSRNSCLCGALAIDRDIYFRTIDLEIRILEAKLHTLINAPITLGIASIDEFRSGA